MLPKKNRASKKDLEGVFRKGLFLTSPNITFKYLKIKNNKKKRIANKNGEQ